MAGALMLFQACAATKPKEDSEISRIESRLIEMNQQIDQLNEQVSTLQFMVDDHQKTITALKKPTGDIQQNPAYPSGVPLSAASAQTTTGSLPAQTLPVPSESAEAAYNQALSVYKSKDYKKAAALFQSIAINYPGHDLADNALYWTGECFYALL